jgi:glycosyltransferase involved in cell wall biosynthesis
MQESPSGFFNLDHPADGAALPAGPVVLRGWAAARLGIPFVDLRLRTADTMHPAVHGFPRADLPGFFGLDAPFLLGGFEAAFFLGTGEQTVTFEALDIAGAWQTVGTVRLRGEGLAPAVVPPAPPALRPHEFARALQFTLRRANTLPAAAAAQELIGLLPVPAVIRYPHAPFHGHLHEPTQLERVLFGRLRLNGWLFHETAAVKRVVATVDLQTWQDLAHDGALPYVAAAFPQFPAAGNCAVKGWIDVPAQLPSPLCVRVYAELADGSWHLCQVQRTHVSDLEQEKVGFAPVGRVGFVRAAFALRRAALDRGFALPWSRLLLRAAAGVHDEYHARAYPRPAPAAPVFADATVPPPLRHVTLVTHNLGHEGAPLFLSELARHLAAAGTRLKVISAQDGPLAAVYAQLGAEVRLVDVGAPMAARSGAELAAAIDRLAAVAQVRDTDLVIANTLSGYWGVHLARRAGRRSLFYIHESTTPVNFYLGQMAPATLPLVESTFRLASHVSFLTESTRAYYRPWLGGASHSLNPGWIDVPAIDRFLATHSRAGLRQKLGLAENTRLVVNLGTVCDRKGQHIFARAVDLFWRRQPALAATGEFLLVGAHDTLFDRDLQDLLTQLNRPNLKLVPATGAPLAYYGAADLSVCSSYEESFPRVIMEAMACRVPILSTAVHGIRDMLTSGEDSWLVAPGDSHALAEGLAHLLANPGQAREFAERARTRVVSQYSTSTLLPRHAALAGRVAAASA